MAFFGRGPPAGCRVRTPRRLCPWPAPDCLLLFFFTRASHPSTARHEGCLSPSLASHHHLRSHQLARKTTPWPTCLARRRRRGACPKPPPAPGWLPSSGGRGGCRGQPPRLTGSTGGVLGGWVHNVLSGLSRVQSVGWGAELRAVGVVEMGKQQRRGRSRPPLRDPAPVTSSLLAAPPAGGRVPYPGV